jgi:hypothetical protein
MNDPTTDVKTIMVNKADALRVARLLSALRGGSPVYDVQPKVPSLLWTEFLMTDGEIQALIKEQITMRSAT